MPATTWIDVHSHFLPQAYRDAMQAHGVDTVDRFPLPDWSVESHLEAMDRGGVTCCVLSISSPGVSFVRGADARSLARAVNEAAAALIAQHPRRFGACAVLPLPDLDGALAEIEHGLDVLGLDGIGLLSNYGGKYLGDPSFEPVWRELDRRRATVFVHPTAPPGFDRLGLDLGFPASAIEYMFDTTRTLASLVGWGRLGQLPNLRLILPHGGGTIPYLWRRMSLFLAGTGHQPAGTKPRDLIEQVRTLHFDTTLANSEPVLAMLRSLVPPSQLLTGCDFPFMLARNMESTVGALGAYAGFDDEERRAIANGNARRLFPRLAARLDG
jgi:predicted TIM-barrel fold metal-dependent hydrolase